MLIFNANVRRVVAFSAVISAISCGDLKPECGDATEMDCVCSFTPGCVECFTEQELEEAELLWAGNCPESDTDTDADSDADADTDADADSDSDADTDTETCLHTAVAGNAPAGWQYATHCHTIGGPDPGSDPGFYSPYRTNSSSPCYPGLPAGSPVTPENVGPVEEELWFASISGSALGGLGGLCPMATGSGDWSYEFETAPGNTCGDYTDEGHAWIQVNANGDQDIVGVEPAYGCGYYNYVPVSAVGFDTSTPIGCVAGSARFDLVPRSFPGNGGVNGTTVQVTPVARTDARFPERAWLRSVSVVSWGDAEKLFISDDGTFVNAQGALTGTADLTAPATSLTRAVGATTMGAHFGIPNMQAGDSLPVVDISWSCQVNLLAPHYTPLSGHESYIANLSNWGINHRFLFHVDPVRKMLKIAPVGRYRDSIQMHYDSTGHFKGRVPALGTTIEGYMSRNGTQLEIDAGRVRVAGEEDVEIVVFAELLPPLP